MTERAHKPRPYGQIKGRNNANGPALYVVYRGKDAKLDGGRYYYSLSLEGQGPCSGGYYNLESLLKLKGLAISQMQTTAPAAR